MNNGTLKHGDEDIWGLGVQMAIWVGAVLVAQWV